MDSVAAGAPFGFRPVLVFLGVFNYLIDAYTIYSASVLAANSALRSLFGAAFPLFTSYYSQGCVSHVMSPFVWPLAKCFSGIHWASSIPAFLPLAYVLIPIVFRLHGAGIRKRCRYAAEADAFMQLLAQSNQREARREEPVIEEPNAEVKAAAFDVESNGKTASLCSVPSAVDMSRKASRASRLSGRSLGLTATQYEEDP